VQVAQSTCAARVLSIVGSSVWWAVLEKVAQVKRRKKNHKQVSGDLKLIMLFFNFRGKFFYVGNIYIEGGNKPTSRPPLTHPFRAIESWTP
jgi:hypothetical protein